MSRELRIYGPPGTGKTTYTARQVEKAAEKYGSDKVLVASFTRTAAAEIAGRGLPLDKSQVGTLHSHCFRALGRPEIAETHIDEWNKTRPDLALSGGKRVSVDEPSEKTGEEDETKRGSTRGDELLAKTQVYRAHMTPEDRWPPLVRVFQSSWDKWKNESGLLDFTDLLVTALREIDEAPGSPAVAFLDEAQDCTPLQMALWRKWCASMESFVIVGDEDQCLYEWAGASPRVMLEPHLPEEQIRVLSQSHRVPLAVHAIANRIVSRIAVRHPKTYAPTPDEGAVRRLSCTWRAPGPLVRDIEEQTAAGRRSMVLGACGYMLRPTVALLRRAGVPFFNPYRRAQGAWNPLASGSDKKQTAVDRLAAYLSNDREFLAHARDEWTWGHVKTWTHHLAAAEALSRGAKKKIGEKPAEESARVEDVIGIFSEEVDFDRVMDHDLRWFLSALLTSKRGIYELAVEVAQRWGKRAIIEPPKDMGAWAPGSVPWTVIGTIHSVKGAEADVVYVFPDLSLKGAHEWSSGGQAGRDSTLRQFYVAVTRARQELVICQPASRLNFPLWGMT